jgi:hypothetical protein
MVIKNKFKMDSYVYLKTDIEQLKRLVIAIKQFTGGSILYELACGDTSTEHWESEIDDTEDTLIKTTN